MSTQAERWEEALYTTIEKGQELGNAFVLILENAKSGELNSEYHIDSKFTLGKVHTIGDEARFVREIILVENSSMAPRPIDEIILDIKMAIHQCYKKYRLERVSAIEQGLKQMHKLYISAKQLAEKIGT